MAQLSLFEAPAPALPELPGLVLVPGFCSDDEQRALLAAIDAEPWSHEYDRRRQHYGSRYDASQLGARRGLPAWLLPLAARVVERGLLPRLPDGCLINEYLPGQGIAPHLDRPGAGPAVVSVSLGSACTLDLVHAEHPEQRHELRLEPKSALLLRGEARTRWLHGIARRKSDVVGGVRVARGRRVSVTLRMRADEAAGG